MISTLFALPLLMADPGNKVTTNSLPKDKRLNSEAAVSYKTIPSIDISAIDATGSPSFVSSEKADVYLDIANDEVKELHIRKAIDSLLKVHGHTQEELHLRKYWRDELGHLHAVFNQTLNGVPIVGGELRVHFSPKGKLHTFSGMMGKSKHKKLSTKPGIAEADAVSKSLEYAGLRGVLFSSVNASSKLVFLRTSRTAELVLAWETKLEGMKNGMPIVDMVYIDTTSGAEIERHSLIQPYLYRQVYDSQHTSNVGTLIRSEGGAPVIDAQINTNYSFLGDAYNYFALLGRDSYNGSGSPLSSSIHVGSYYNNAYWNGNLNRLYFGDGDGYTFGPFTNGLDIVAHELGHGVTQYSSGLIYADESGAINEAMSDIFGAMTKARKRGNGVQLIDYQTWLVGEDVYTPYTSGDALRYMDNPTIDGYSSDWYPERYVGYDDNGGVHGNSGIANLAFKLAVTGGAHPRAASVGQPMNIPALDGSPSVASEIAQKIFYRANTTYLDSTSDFAALRAATTQAAQDLADANLAPSNARQIMHLVWDGVGVPYISGNSRAVNISTRCDVGTGQANAVVGFVVNGGSTPQDMLVRGIGPTLGTFGVPNALSDPQLQLFNGATLIDSNDNWYQAWNASAIASTASSVYAFPLANPSLDSSILRTFGSGSYSANLSGINSATGNGMVEVYATDYNNPNRLINISTRAPVGSNPAICGFVIKGEGYKRLLIRAVGPTLANYGITAPLADPILSLYAGTALIRQNDDWGTEANATEIVSTAQSIGAFELPASSKDSVILIDLPPGTYTAYMAGVNSSSGIGMIEVYEVE